MDAQVNGGDSSYLLSCLEVFNWGPFRGMHRAEFDPLGTAIIGPTGSGKTTLVDALMTLLVAQPRYNLASTGGHESDRTLISYVRGVLGGDGSDGREEVARPGKSLTGICATYCGGERTLRLAALFWTEGVGNAADDLKRRWIFSLAEEHSLETWLRLLHDDGIRDLLRVGRETANLRIFDSKKAYLSHVRKFFDVGENAFTLLNRAAGLKQLNSIDEIFRDLVLDDHSAFDRALEVADEFDNLAAIHAELETAKKQQESLLPVAEEYDRLLNAQRKMERYRTLKRILPVWFAILGSQKWAEEAENLRASLNELQKQLDAECVSEEVVCARVELLRERYLQLGGNVIGELENTIELRKDSVALKKKYAAQYLHIVRKLGLNEELTEQFLRQNQVVLQERRKQEQQQRDRQEEKTLATLSEVREQEGKLKEIELLLRRVKQRPGSNIPPQYQDFRGELAHELHLSDSDLPFVAELIEVKSAESAWRGAIERAIGAERLRVLVPENVLDAALRWVNHRDNRLHVRLQAASKDAQGETRLFADGFVKKLNFKVHPLSEAAKRLLANRDLHCVDSTSVLKSTEHALTIQGLMSGKQGRFEKQDQRRLDQDWMTGFDNKDQLDALAKSYIATEEIVTSLQRDAQENRKQLSLIDEQLQMMDALLEIDYTNIDLPKAESELERAEARLASLLDPLSDASQAKALYEAENRRLTQLRVSIGERRTEIGVLESKQGQALGAQKISQERIGPGLNPEETAIAASSLKVAADIAAQRVDAEERRYAKLLEEKYEEMGARLADNEQQLVRKMELAKRVDTGALAEVGSDIADVPLYLERLRVLTDEALPEKRARFLEYLNRSSDQGVTQLLASIDEEVDTIEHRIGELNQTLVKVDFRLGRYLQLQPQRMKDERLRTLDAAMRKVRSAALKDDGGESHFRALQEMIAILREAGENRRLQGSRALLDPRFRLQFFVVEVDRRTGDRSPPRTGSQSGSGGEKELMASHILTASLSYALCPSGATRPLYATVILDEAFSKSSPSAASRIIEALRIFGLHPIFVTPNKEIGLLKQHTRKVICVQRPGKEASLASISWERLNEVARPR